MDSRFELEEAQASFRGVPFWVIKRERGGGRRGPSHQMPMRDEPDGEDLGRKVRTFSVTAMVIGQGSSDAEIDADAKNRALQLLSALEDKAGPGIYLDPWHGRWSVICRTHKAGDDIGRAGVVTFDLSFEESGDSRYPQASTSTPTMVGASSDNLVTAAVNDFKRSFSLAGQPSWVGDAAKGTLGDAASAIKSLRLTQLDPLSALGVGDASASVASLQSSVSSLTSSTDIGTTTANAVRGVGSSSYSTRSGDGDPQAARAAWAGLGSWSPQTPTNLSTPARQALAANQAAIAALVQRLAVTEEARALAASNWDSIDQAQSQLSDLVSRLQTVQQSAQSSESADVSSATLALRSAAVADVAARAPASRQRTVTLSAVTPAVVLAYRLTGDATQASDLATRNGVQNRLFMPGGAPLEYLSNG